MCKRELDAGEPIYRVVVGYRIQWYARFGDRVIGSICEECCGRYPSLDHPEWSWLRTPRLSG
jgi:hypothetical protein